MKRSLPFLLCMFISAQVFSQALIISEFRLRGINGSADDFVELYNNSDADITVAGSGYSLVTSSGSVVFTIPNGTIIPARGHYLAANSFSYSLSGYPAGSGATAIGDITYALDIPDNTGIALFNNSSVFTLANRLDAVGPTSEANTLYKEGTGYNVLTPFSVDYTFYRKSEAGYPVDAGNNAADFRFGDTNGTSAGAGQFLGAPGPENLSSPIYNNTANTIPFTLANPITGSPVNFTRDFTSNPAQNSTFGTIRVRFKIVNNTGSNLTRLRIRIDSLCTYPAPAGIADLRPFTAGDETIGGITYTGTTLEQPPSQLNGGGDNSSMSVNSISTATPLAAGATAYFSILFGIQQEGDFKIFLHTESLPAGGGPELVVRGTNTALLPITLSKFTIQNLNCTAKLNWTTASEINSSRFAIQHSTDGINFKEIASVPAAGISSLEKNYTYNATLLPGNNYFRLRMIDIDGSNKFSKILAAKGNCIVSTIIVYPNPVNDVLTVNGLTGNGTLILTDNTGTTIQLVKFSKAVQQIITKSLVPGTYFIQVQKSNAITETVKIVKD